MPEDPAALAGRKFRIHQGNEPGRRDEPGRRAALVDEAPCSQVRLTNTAARTSSPATRPASTSTAPALEAWSHCD